MVSAGYEFKPHDAPPVEIAPPKKFETVDLYPTATFTASRRKVSAHCKVVERSDEHGICLVSHFKVAGTLVVLYQSALDEKDHWTVFADMLCCINNDQAPSKLGRSFVRYLTAASIAPDWVNSDADAVYRSGRLKLSKASLEAFNSLIKATKKKLAPTSSKSHGYRDDMKDIPMVAQKVFPVERIRALATKKAATPSPLTVKKTGTSLPRVAAAKKATPAKRVAAAKKAVASKK